MLDENHSPPRSSNASRRTSDVSARPPVCILHNKVRIAQRSPATAHLGRSLTFDAPVVSCARARSTRRWSQSRLTRRSVSASTSKLSSCRTSTSSTSRPNSSTNSSVVRPDNKASAICSSTTLIYLLFRSGCKLDFQCLHLESCTLSDTFFALPTHQFAQNRVELTHLVLRKYAFSWHSLHAFPARGCPRTCALTLRVSSCSQLNMTSLITMSALLSRSLLSLELSSCRLARQAGILLSQSLQSCISLRRLVLADNNLRDGGVRAVVDALKARSSAVRLLPMVSDYDDTETSLDELDISRNGVTSACFAALSSVCVRRIDASENAIDSIGSFLRSTSTLVSLNLAGNPLSEDGAHELFSTLFREHSTLQVLDLRRCRLSPTSAAFLSQALRASSFCSLRELFLDDVAWTAHDSDRSKDQSVHSRREVAALVASTKFPSFQVRLSNTLTLEPPGRRTGTATPGASAERSIEAHVEADVESPRATHDVVQQARPTGNSYASTTKALVREAQVDKPAAPTASGSSTRSTNDYRSLTGAPGTQHTQQQTQQWQHVDVEYIVSKTIECMNQNFEQRLGLFLLKMESQQQEKVRACACGYREASYVRARQCRQCRSRCRCSERVPGAVPGRQSRRVRASAPAAGSALGCAHRACDGRRDTAHTTAD